MRKHNHQHSGCVTAAGRRYDAHRVEMLRSGIPQLREEIRASPDPELRRTLLELELEWEDLTGAPY